MEDITEKVEEGVVFTEKVEDVFQAEGVVEETWIGNVAFLRQHGVHGGVLEVSHYSVKGIISTGSCDVWKSSFDKDMCFFVRVHYTCESAKHVCLP